MQNLGVALLYPLILVAGALQAFGPPMNGALHKTFENPWLGSLISFAPIVAVLAVMVLCLPAPLPSAEAIEKMPWWAPLGGIIGAVAVVVGLMFVGRVGAGALAGLTITANILTSLAVGHFGWFGIETHPINGWRIAGGMLMVGGITLISKFG
jgi:transporter family-2 protein